MSSAQPAGAAYPPTSTNAYAAPPPAGYPTKDGPTGYSQNQQPLSVETKSRGDDGFLKGCCAALCCCCVLDACF